MTAVPADLQPVTLTDVGAFIRRARRWLLAGMLGGVALGVTAGWLLPKKYRANAVIAIVSPTESKFGGAASQLGGLASLVGLDLGGLGGSGANRGEAIETLKSREISRRLIEQRNLMPVLYPADNEGEHTLEQAVTRFTRSILKVSENKVAGTFDVSVIWGDRQVAADWLRGLIALADGELRERAVTEAQRSIDYLQAEARKTEVAELRDSIYRLIDGHLRTIVVAKTRSDFAFRTIDPPVPPDVREFDSPRRAVLILLGLLLGPVAAALLFVLLGGRDRASSARADRGR